MPPFIGNVNIAFVIMLGLGLLHAFALANASTYTATASAGGIGCSRADSSATGGSASCVGSVGGISSVKAIAGSAPGILRVDAQSFSARSSDGFGVFGGNTQATAFFDDTIFFGVDTGTFVIPLDLDGSVEIIDGGVGNSNALAELSGGVTGAGASIEFFASANSGNQSLVVDAVFAFTGGFLNLSGGLRADAKGCSIIDSGSTCTASAAFGSSLRFLGGTLFDENGSQLNGVSVTSESGFDYLAGVEPHDRVNAVPLPPGILMLFSSVMAIPLAKRLSRRARRIASRQVERGTA